MSNLKFAIDAEKLSNYLAESTANGGVGSKIVFEVDYDASSGTLVPVMYASIENPIDKGTESFVSSSAPIKICPSPPGNCG